MRTERRTLGGKGFTGLLGYDYLLRGVVVQSTKVGQGVHIKHPEALRDFRDSVKVDGPQDLKGVLDNVLAERTAARTQARD